ncbi:MAG: acireductone synthase [Gammaproteobacteria bacterium]
MIRAIVTDIEGTTSSIRFVHDVLFPYARAHMREFVLRHADDARVAVLLEEVRKATGPGADLEGLIQQLLDWIDQDKKITSLKALQGLIWEQGYREGDFHGHVYPDAVDGLRKWQAQGIALYVYSSGSVHAQKLLFAHTEYGDLTPLFSGYFDTHIGAKTEIRAYQHIVESVGIPSGQILFLSDVPAELDAAHAAGLKTCWLIREGLPAEHSPHPQARSFRDIDVSALAGGSAA